MATFLQLLKETGMRCGEACQLKWTDIGLINNSVRITPEKGGNPRNLKISNKLVGMLSAMLKDSAKVFNSNTDVMRRNFTRQRKRIAAQIPKPQNKPNNISHIPALESHHGIPQNQGHPPRQRTPRTQVHKQHFDLHAACKFRRRRVHSKSSPFREGSMRAGGGWLRVCVRLQRKQNLQKTQVTKKH